MNDWITISYVESSRQTTVSLPVDAVDHIISGLRAERKALIRTKRDNAVRLLKEAKELEEKEAQNV